jgi:hypothetical protein
MKVQLVTFADSVNGLSLHVVPETEEERELLRAFWRFGQLERCNSIDTSGAGFSITWNQRNSVPVQAEGGKHFRNRPDHDEVKP